VTLRVGKSILKEKSTIIMTALRVLLLGTALASIGLCGTITETENNGSSSDNTLATAQAIPTSAFTTPSPIGVFSTQYLAATINGLGGGQDVDFYSFQASGGIQLSITDNPFTFPTILSLYNSAGDLLAFDDSSTPLKPGSASTLDSYIGIFMLPSAGTYYVAVSNAGASIPNYPDTSSCTGFGSLTRPDGGSGAITTTGCDSSSSVFAFGGPQPAAGSLAYTLVIAQTPEPGTFVLMGLGVLGFVLFQLRTARKAAQLETR
jgi:hypothetical protein